MNTEHRGLCRCIYRYSMLADDVAAACGLRAAAHATRLFPLGRVLIAPNLKSANFENLIFIRAVRTVQLLMH